MIPNRSRNRVSRGIGVRSLERKLIPKSGCIIAAAIAMGLCGKPLVAQATPPKTAPATQNAKNELRPQAGKEWKTPWGDPDLEGSWSNATTTPLERPAKYGGREFLTEQERAEQDQQTAVGTDKRDRPGTFADVNAAYNNFWWDRGWSDGRTSLIYDPKDGRIPQMAPEAQKRHAEFVRLDQANEELGGSGVFNGPEDLSLYTRCVIRAGLPRISTGYDNSYQIVQAPGYVAILQEQMHETRIIPLDGRPHLAQSVRQWLGDSRGHWEGKTLVVETTNFGDQTDFQGSGRNLRLIERWTRVSDGRVEYRFTVEDATAWTKPWSAAIGWNKTGMLYEYACHEDNVGLYGILAGARAQEKAAQASGSPSK
jgi:hypothetical protein